MKRLVACMAAVIGLGVGVVFGGPRVAVDAQDTTDDRVSALETVVAGHAREIERLEDQVGQLRQGREVATDTDTDEAPSSSEPEALVPFGETLTTPLWEVRVLSTEVLPNLNTGEDVGYLVVVLETVNVTAEERGFGPPDATFAVETDDGRTLQYDIFATAQLANAKGEWSGNFAAGSTHESTLVFPVLQGDPALNFGSPEGLVLLYEQEEEQPGVYRMELDR